MKYNNHIFNYVKAVAEPSIKERGYYLFKLVEDWNLIVDEHIYTHALPIKLNFYKNNNCILTLKINNAIISTDILHYKEVILFKVNKYFGFNCVHNIKLTN